MKRVLTSLCALAIVMAGSVPALAAQTDPESVRRAACYPISVEEYMEGDSPRIKKVYQLSLNEDPASIPTGDFERDGRLYYLLDMTKQEEVGVDTQPYTQTVTLDSDTGKLEEVLKRLDPELETTTEDGYTAPCPWTIPASPWRRRATPPGPAVSPPPAPIPTCPTRTWP